jgi:hypothetical protein
VRLGAAQSVDVEIFQSDSPSLQIVGDSRELIDTIKTDFVGPTLKISHQVDRPFKVKCGNKTVSFDKNGTSSTMIVNDGIKHQSECALFKIGVKEIPAIMTMSSGNVHFAGANQANLVIKLSSSGGVTGDGIIYNLMILVISSGDVGTTNVNTKSSCMYCPNLEISQPLSKVILNQPS